MQLLLLLLLLLPSPVLSQPPCKAGLFFPGHELPNQPISALLSLSPIGGQACGRLCYAEPACAAFSFQASFFDTFTQPSAFQREGGSSALFKTKFPAKVFAAANKNPRGATRLHAYFAAQGASNIFVLRVELKSGMARMHSLHYEEAVIMQPMFRREEAPFHLAGPPKFLHAVLERMHGTEEASLLASPTIVQFQSYHETGEASVRGALHTALSYAVSEFDGAVLDFGAAGDILVPLDDLGSVPLVAVTFNIKELAVSVGLPAVPAHRRLQALAVCHGPTHGCLLPPGSLPPPPLLSCSLPLSLSPECAGLCRVSSSEQ
jgi:hypothetical protein